MEELKTCPFCGAEATFVEARDEGGQWECVIGCSNDSTCWIRPYVAYNSKKEAIDIWNTRK